MRILFNLMLLDKQEFSEHRFVTIMFDQLLKSSCEDFLTHVKQAKIDWIKNPTNFDCARSMIDFTKMYANYTSTGHWDKVDVNAPSIIALVTTINRERDKNIPKVPNTPGAPGDGRPGLEIWKFESVGEFKTVGGIKYLFCTEPGRKDDKGNGGMYIPLLHDHPEWLSVKQKKQDAWKENRKKAKATGKHKAPDVDPASDADPTKLSLSKTSKAALTSKVNMSCQEAEFLVNKT